MSKRIYTIAIALLGIIGGLFAIEAYHSQFACVADLALAEEEAVKTFKEMQRALRLESNVQMQQIIQLQIEQAVEDDNNQLIDKLLKQQRKLQQQAQLILEKK